MTSAKQINANRENGKLGGVKTPQGKEIVRMNALKHGLTGSIITDPEELSLFQSITASLIEEYEPVGTMEHFLIDRIALYMTRLQRITKIETSVIDLLSTENNRRDGFRMIIHD